MIKKTLLVIALLLLLIQLVRPARNESSAPMPTSLTSLYSMPDSVAVILQLACNDCHSNQTRYPWYDRIAPPSWFVAYHVKGGKRHLNFDEFASYPIKKQVKRLKDIVKTVQSGAMPLSSYTWMHKDAVLTAAQKAILCNWADGLRQRITDTTKAAL